jgi:hypothetical protein
MVTVSIFSSMKQYRDYTTIYVDIIFARLMVKPNNRVVMPCMLGLTHICFIWLLPIPQPAL